MANASRMTSYQRREQLIDVGRSLFASKGFEAVSVEEIASSAKVSKPIVYEHFGGKEGLYAVIVDREMRSLTEALAGALLDTDAHPRQIVERAALALLTYIEENTEGFQILVRDSPSTDPAGSFSSLLGDVSVRVEQILAQWFHQQHLPAKGAPYYAQMLVGLTVFTGQYWANQRKVSKEQLAAHIVNLAWHGLSRLEAKPELRYEGARARRLQERRMAEAQKHAAHEAGKDGDSDHGAPTDKDTGTDAHAAVNAARGASADAPSTTTPSRDDVAVSAASTDTADADADSDSTVIDAGTTVITTDSKTATGTVSSANSHAVASMGGTGDPVAPTEDMLG